MEVQEDKVGLECDAMRMQHKMDMQTLQRIEAAAKVKGRGDADSDSDYDAKKKMVYDKIVVKMPRAPPHQM